MLSNSIAHHTGTTRERLFSCYFPRRLGGAFSELPRPRPPLLLPRPCFFLPFPPAFPFPSFNAPPCTAADCERPCEPRFFFPGELDDDLRPGDLLLFAFACAVSSSPSLLSEDDDDEEEEEEEESKPSFPTGALPPVKLYAALGAAGGAAAGDAADADAAAAADVEEERPPPDSPPDALPLSRRGEIASASISGTALPAIAAKRLACAAALAGVVSPKKSSFIAASCSFARLRSHPDMDV